MSAPKPGIKISISKDGQRYGPYSEEELNGQLDAGSFDLEDLASTDGGRSWVAIRMLPAIIMKPFAVQIDEPGNLLVIRYRGRVGALEVEECAHEVQAVLRKLQPGFRILVDLTCLEAMDVFCASQIGNIMKRCNAKGVATVARGIPDPRRDIGWQMMSSLHYGPQAGSELVPA